MICPNCNKPYYFINPKQRDFSLCFRCGHTDNFQHPVYDDYHENLYEKKIYTRTAQTDPQMKFILKKMKLQASDTILDVGCGIGDYTKAISLITRNVTGLDRTVEAAQKKYPGVNFLTHDCNKALPYPDNSFDAVVSINLIEHLIDYKNLLSEFQRVLKPDGRIAITTANLDFILHDYFFDKTHVHEWTLKEFKNIIGQYFTIQIAEKSSSMFNYYPINFITTKFLKPDLLFIGTKKHD